MPERRISASRIDVRIPASVPDARRVAAELPAAIAQRLATSVRRARTNVWIPQLAVGVKVRRGEAVAGAVTAAIANALRNDAQRGGAE